jgi:hypothetical protein
LDPNPFEPPLTDSKPPSRTARQMRATLAIFVVVLLTVVVSLLIMG